jgi:hypothetical protein
LKSKAEADADERRRANDTDIGAVNGATEPETELRYVGDDWYLGGNVNKIAQLAPCLELVVATFDELEKINPAALTLIKNTFGDNARSMYETGLDDTSTYLKAVFLNTAAAAASVGVDLSKAKFVEFYWSDKVGPNTNNKSLPFGFYVEGISGVTSGRHKGIGSVEIDTDKIGIHIDVDLYKGGFPGALGKHGDEVAFNDRHKRPTHPGDVALQLAARGINSGVDCKN